MFFNPGLIIGGESGDNAHILAELDRVKQNIKSIEGTVDLQEQKITAIESLPVILAES